MSRTSITLPGDLVNELMAEMQAKSKTEAVIRAIKDEIRARKKEKIKTDLFQLFSTRLYGQGNFSKN